MYAWLNKTWVDIVGDEVEPKLRQSMPITSYYKMKIQDKGPLNNMVDNFLYLSAEPE